jgi:hypothetical protein
MDTAPIALGAIGVKRCLEKITGHFELIAAIMGSIMCANSNYFI